MTETFVVEGVVKKVERYGYDHYYLQESSQLRRCTLLNYPYIVKRLGKMVRITVIVEDLK